ncbi:hypothetical protein WJX81_001885 [Elliptochloris bilobata]|uniref:Amine oxidase domain-containing protein n=1 Tax=Elliptochloris bilobata TaxID=381761 RepID=A0AAW1REJ0_9CHLO
MHIKTVLLRRGFGAAHALAKAHGVDVLLLDSAESPGGLSTGWRTLAGRPLEPGVKGFWSQYANIHALADELGIQPFTGWAQSRFLSPAGLEVTAPVLRDRPRLPTPLGSLVHSSPFFQRLPLADRLSAWPLVTALLEHALDADAYAAYDAISAQHLFLGAGISPRLYWEFLEPMLLVTLFAPGAELSAAAALAMLYYFVLARQDAFDVRWCRGSVAEQVFKPWRARLEAAGVRLLGGRRALCVLPGQAGRRFRVEVSAKGKGAEECHEADAIVLAVGVKAMQQIVAASPQLAAAPDLAHVRGLGTDDVMAVRLWLDGVVRPATASNVVAGFDAGVGATVFDLSSLQDEFRERRGSSVVEADFYHAGSLLALTDDQVVEHVQEKYLGAAAPAYRQSRVLDASVLRFPGAVTAFAPGSHGCMPRVRTGVPGVFCAADWVAQGPGDAAGGAKGLSQEKALASGLEAGNLAAASVGRRPGAHVFPAAPDEPHVAAARSALRLGRQLGVPLQGLPR